MGVAVYLDPGIARSPENGLVLGGSGRFWAVLGGSGHWAGFQKKMPKIEHTKPTPEADAPLLRPAERQIFFTPGFLRCLGDVPENSRKIQGRVSRVFYL